MPLHRCQLVFQVALTCRVSRTQMFDYNLLSKVDPDYIRALSLPLPSRPFTTLHVLTTNLSLSIMSYASLVSTISTTLWICTLTAPWRQSKAFSSKSLRASSKGESKRRSIATLIQTSHSVVALFASATLVPSSTSFVGASDAPAATDDQPLALAHTESKCTLKRSNAVRKAHAIAIATAPSTVQLKRTQTMSSVTTSECESGSGSSHHCPTLEGQTSSCGSPATTDHPDRPASGLVLDDFVQSLEQGHMETLRSRGGYAGFTSDEVKKWLAEDHDERRD